MSKKPGLILAGNVHYSGFEESTQLICIIILFLFFNRLESNFDVANRVNAEVVTKPEIATLGDIFVYMNQSAAKVL